MKSVSIVIPTFNGGHKVDTVLNGLKHQSRHPDEIIVVVDGSTDDTVSKLSGWASVLSNLNVIIQENKGRAAVRNRGAAEARGDILVFLDDDMFTDPQWLANHMRHHEENQDTVLAGPQIDPIYEIGCTDFQKFKSYLSQKWSRELEIYNKKPLPGSKVFLTAANFSIPKNLFLKIGGFDNRLNDGEDFDFAFRATRLGVPVYYDSDVSAWHYERSNCRDIIRRHRCYFNAGKFLSEIEPELYMPLFGHRKNMQVTLKMRVAQVFCNRFWIKSIDKNLWTWLPKTVRFKLYDMVITANTIYFPDRVVL